MLTTPGHHRVTTFIMSTHNPAVGSCSVMTACYLSAAAYVMLSSSVLFSHAGRPQFVPKTQRLLFLYVAIAHCTEQPGTAGLHQTGQRQNKTVGITHSSVIVSL